MVLLQVIKMPPVLPLVILFTVAILFYFIPSMIAYNKISAVKILVLNFFLGWTVIGWVIALIWAFYSPRLEVVLEEDDLDLSPEE